MPKAEINGINIHYELDGNGQETVVFLNGIMMSTVSWAEFVTVYTKNNYQFLRMDFRDQGQSEKFTQEYDVSIHIDDLRQLLDHLEIDKVHLVGISYGAMVAMLFELKYPDRVSTLILSNTEGRVTKYLQAVSNVWEEAAKLNDSNKFFKLSMPFIYSDKFYNENWEWLEKRRKALNEVLTRDWFEALIRLSKSSKHFDLQDRVDQIQTPTLLIGGTRDQLTPVYEMEKLEEKIPDSKMIIIKGAGHASCYEKMDEFNTAVLGFIALQNS